MKSIAFIGTRELELLPELWVKLYGEAVVAAVQHGYRIVTGAAPGADQLAANRALTLGGTVELVLPWRSYESEWVETVKSAFGAAVPLTVYDPRQHEEWTRSVREHHPNAERLTQGPRALHARNYGIVHYASAVVALPSRKLGGGGTGQGIRIAEAYGIKLFNLSLEADRIQLQAGLLKKKEAPSAP